MSVRNILALPAPDASFAAPWIADVNVKRAKGQGFVKQQIVSRAELAVAVALLAIQTVVHAAAVGGRVVFAASKLALLPFRPSYSPRAELRNAVEHGKMAFRSGAGVVAALPGFIRPEWATDSFKKLSLYSAPKSYLERARDVVSKAWNSPQRNNTLIGAAVVVAAVAGLGYMLSPASVPPPPPPPPPVETNFFADNAVALGGAAFAAVTAIGTAVFCYRRNRAADGVPPPGDGGAAGGAG